MALRSILVHLHVGEPTTARVAAAAALAMEHDAHLVGLAPTGWTMGLADATGGFCPPGYMEATIDLLREQAEAAVSAFEVQARALGVASFEGRVQVSDAAWALAQSARYCDLTVMTQAEPGHWITTEAPDMPAQVLMHSGRPLLMLPYAGQAVMPPNGKVLVGWDGSREAARALADALPLLERAASVAVAVFQAPRDVESRHGELPGADIGLWLARHGVKVDVQHIPTDVAVGEALLSHAADVQAELIVAGGYGHSRFRETVLGGVTRTLLRSSPVPSLLSH
jgi:nucleotide-binding universal stress UspA family protein